MAHILTLVHNTNWKLWWCTRHAANYVLPQIALSEQWLSTYKPHRLNQVGFSSAHTIIMNKSCLIVESTHQIIGKCLRYICDHWLSLISAAKREDSDLCPILGSKPSAFYSQAQASWIRSTIYTPTQHSRRRKARCSTGAFLRSARTRTRVRTYHAHEHTCAWLAAC